jgi:hypothetical protein
MRVGKRLLSRAPQKELTSVPPVYVRISAIYYRLYVNELLNALTGVDDTVALA